MAVQSSAEETFVLDTRRYFSNTSVWPRQPHEVDPSGWLSNFANPVDRSIALQLLDSFLLISTEQSTKMVSSAFHGLAASRYDMFSLSPSEYSAAWGAFRSSVSVTYPARKNDPASSGHIFARAARQLVADATAQLHEPDALIEEMSTTGEARSLVFVDDFAGTGNQFVDAWFREVALPGGATTSFATLEARGLVSEALFLPAVCTADARALIRERVPIVETRPGHLLPPRYSARAHDTVLVPDTMRSELPRFLERHADAAGYTSGAMYGYGGCGLALSFEHSTPDNTLPIFNGGPARPVDWKPLRSI